MVSATDYKKAYKSGKKEYQNRLMAGKRPTLEVLDEILPPNEALVPVSLGLVQIPIDQIAGTRYSGRSSSFAANFMPILPEGSEFAAKWINLCNAHEQEGIRDPIKAYEYMNKFYVEEGNKRVSVLKYYDAVSIPGNVTRLLPRRTDEPENRIYFEFLDFYKLTKINYIWFSKEGSFQKLLDLASSQPGEIWTDDEKLIFSSVYTRFTMLFEANGGKKLSITPGDAFLSFISLYDYKTLDAMSATEMKQLVSKSWEEFTILEEDTEVDLKMAPTTEKKPLVNRLLDNITHTHLTVAFIYDKTASSSSWTYSHELGRLHLEQVFPDEIQTKVYDNVTADTIDACLETAIADGCNVIFTTTPVFVHASVKAAIAHPDVHILNCSLNTSHRYIRTYYPRMHEAKFLMGAIAGAMADDNRIVYIADYPLYGTIAHINAFALGAKLVNPRAEIFLEWSTLKDYDLATSIDRIHPNCVSARDMVIPDDLTRFFGLYHVAGKYPRNLAMPLCHWGKMYEKLIRTIMDGTWKKDDTSAKAINYWWGMSSGMVDVICSQNLPHETMRLIDLLRSSITNGSFQPFDGALYSQQGLVPGTRERNLSPSEVMEMNWLAANVIGRIPSMDELVDQAKPVLSQQGVK